MFLCHGFVMACQVHNCHARLWISSKAQSTIDSVFLPPKTTSRGIGKQFRGRLDPRSVAKVESDCQSYS